MNPIDLVVTVCAVLSPATCQETHLMFPGPLHCGSARWARRLTSLSGSASIRNGTPCGGAANIRIQTIRLVPPEHPLPGSRTLQRGRLSSAPHLLQSFKSLSAIENTESALISMSRTTQCRWSR